MAELEHRPVVHDHEEVLTRARRRRGFQEAYDALETDDQVANELISARACAGLTQDAVAQRMGTTKSAVSRLQSAGKHKPSVGTLQRNAEAICESPRRLLALAVLLGLLAVVACTGPAGGGVSVHALEIEPCGIVASVHRGRTHVDSVGLTNSGTGAVSVQAIEVNQDWVSVSPSTIPSLEPGERDDLIVTLDASGLAPGLYDAMITITHAPSEGGASSQGLVRIDLNVTSGEPTQPYPGSVLITVTGLPAELAPDLTLVAPGCRTISLAEGQRLDDAAPGEYRLTIHPRRYGVTDFTADTTTLTGTLEPGNSSITLSARYAPGRDSMQVAVERLNEYRIAAGLPPVVGAPEDSLPQWLHTRYASYNGTTGHYEDPNLPWSTPEGHEAAVWSNLAYDSVFSDDNYRDPSNGSMWVDVWAQAPYHMFSLLDPRTTSVRFAWFRSEHGESQRSTAAMQPIRTAAWGGAVVRFPAADATANIAVFRAEAPSPLANCPGYVSPAGLPIFFMMGPSGVPRITSTTLTRNGAPVEHCAYDGHTDKNRFGFPHVSAYGAAVLVPRYPLVPDSTYQVRFVTDQGVVEWSFHTASVLIHSLSASVIE